MSSFTPVDYSFREQISEEITKRTRGKIFFFSPENKLDDAEGTITAIEEIQDRGIFILLDPQRQIRIDRIITLFGKPGPACDEYYAYGNSCMECHGGYDQ
jgi:hypothetical protein